MVRKAAVVYCSPGGSTRHVAQVIQDRLEAAGMDVMSLDLGKNDPGGSSAGEVIREVQEGEVLLCVGSPVYVNRPVPPVSDFISKLPEGVSGLAVPFVTWGAVSSGIALYEMGNALTEKGLTLVGAAKCVGPHSIMWPCDNVLGAGHPDAEDDQQIGDLVAGVLKKTAAGSPAALSLSELAYQPEKVHREMEQVTLEKAKAHLPEKRLDADRCTECGVCEEICPVAAITLSPYPVFGPACICCFSCVRECPESAILADLAAMEERILGRAAQLAERPWTKIWV